MEKIINEMKEVLATDKYSEEQKKLLREFIESWESNIDNLGNQIKNL